MNRCLFASSESIVLSLCKEIEYIKTRSKNINLALKTCHNKSLLYRLKLELNNLDKTRLKIISISENMFNRNSKDLSFEFLLEISKRSNLQQI
tara:strand:+ start:375 stop:653 length:279 start_codon:yes stop_codon:yes gene_type:complete